MFKIYKKGSPNKIRDINIAIAYHNTGVPMHIVGKIYGVSGCRVRQIHYCLVRHVLKCMNKYECMSQMEKKNHSRETASYLKEYRQLLEENELKTEITLNDLMGKPALVLSTCREDGAIFIRICSEHDAPEICIDDLKNALRKISAK